MSTFLVGMALGYAIGNIGLIITIGTTISLGYTLGMVVKSASSLISLNYDKGGKSKKNKKDENTKEGNNKVNDVEESKGGNTIE